VFWNLFRSDIMLLKCLKIFWKSIDKKTLRQGRHLMLLFPPPKIMLSKEETFRKTQILLKFCITFGVTLYLVKLRYIYVFDFMHISWSYKVLAQIYFRTSCLNLHHFSYFTARFGVILLGLLSDTRNFSRFFIFMEFYSLFLWFQLPICLLQGLRSRNSCSISL
jgi:hypothetical protein